uniref:Zinc finger SWIM domain-containing protein 1 n=1 Tax=Pogona vitticeps TaxID=103695 RepID=A0A6J0UTS4_9SAUR
MALDTVEELLNLDCGSLVAYQLDKNSQLDSISFQTMLMREVFLNHPEVVLIHRTHNTWGKVLYVFMVDKPFLSLEGEMTKVIHFSIPTKESAKDLARLYRTFKAFNPEWKQIKTFLVDPQFRLLSTLSEAFPSAEVTLSVFHICKHLQHKIHRVSLELHTERLILSAVRNAMCAPSESNLRNMHLIVSKFVKPDLLPELHKDWLLNEKIWALHRWRTWKECSQYFKDLEVITRSLSQGFGVRASLETCMANIIRHYQMSVSKSSLSSPAALLIQNISSFHNSMLLNSPPAKAQKPLLPRDPPPAAPQATLEPREEVAKEAIREREAEVSTQEARGLLRQSLADLCTEPAAQLCLNELAVVQSSVHLMGTHEHTVNVQLLEDAQTVRPRAPSSCMCHFSQTFRLPCRHLLAVLNAEGKDLEPRRIPAQWRKGPGTSLPGHTDTDGLLDVPRSSWNQLLDKYLAVSFLTTEISRLLSQCSQEEFDRRYSTLRELADSWIGPYVQVKL